MASGAALNRCLHLCERRVRRGLGVVFYDFIPRSGYTGRGLLRRNMQGGTGYKGNVEERARGWADIHRVSVSYFASSFFFAISILQGYGLLCHLEALRNKSYSFLASSGFPRSS